MSEATVTLLDRAAPRQGERALVLAPPGDLQAFAPGLLARLGDSGHLLAFVAGEPYLQADLHPAVQVIESAIDDAKTLGEARLRGRFDLVVAFGSFPWLPAEPTFLAAVLRSLRPGGRFVFDVPALGYCDALEACEGRHFHWPLVSEQDFQAALEDSGFRACSVETIDSTRNFATLAELVDERSKPFPLDFENTLGVERQEALRNDLAAWFDRDHDLLLVLRHIAGQAMR